MAIGGLLKKVIGDVRQIDEILYRSVVDLKLHMHRQSLLASSLVRAVLPGGTGIQSTILVLLAVRVAASVFSLAMKAFDEYMESIGRGSAGPAQLPKRPSLSSNRLFRLTMQLLEDEELGAVDEDEEEEAGEAGGEEAGALPATEGTAGEGDDEEP